MTITPLAAVLGHPISHSKSPILHNFWLKKYNIHGFYIPIDVAVEDLGFALNALPKLGFKGVNITVPLKEAVMPHIHHMTDRVKMIGAANILSFSSSGEIVADNTDGIGFLKNIQSNAPAWLIDRPVLVIGAGGAARAIITALRDAGIGEIRIANRTSERAQRLNHAFNSELHICQWEELSAKETLHDIGLVVNTTSLGMVGQPPLNMNLSHLNANAVVTDIVYTPLQTPLLKQASERGHQIVDGLGMLLHQAVPAFQSWFGIQPEVTQELRELVLSHG